MTSRKPRLTTIQAKLLSMAAETAHMSPRQVLEEIAAATGKPRKVASWRDCLNGQLGEVWDDLPLEAELVAFDFSFSLQDMSNAYEPRDA